jgi:hypothetical protein
MHSMNNIIAAAERVGTVKRIVFTQAGAGLVDPEEGDTLGRRMESVLDGIHSSITHTSISCNGTNNH